MKELPKAYEPKDYEDKIYRMWEESGLFNPDVCITKKFTDKRADYFSIVLPPPNVTGTLHMGHAAMLAIQDTMVRYHRMKGDRTLWVPGTDHAAIATQTKVEKLLIEKGTKDPKKELGREKFLDEVNKFAQASHDTIVNQCRKMGSSLDWSREAFTLDEQRNLAVRTVFKKMYDDGLIYRGYRIVNWCPRCQSTLADDEVEYKPVKTKLYWIKYGPFVLATTRPETKLGDTAVAVNPKDKRYKKMVGKKFMIPGVLGEFEIVVVADDAVDMNFGSGAIKVTPYHSFADYEIAQRHKIPGKQIINEQGRMMENCGKYAGMTTEEARTAIVEDMEKMGLIDHVEDYDTNLSICYRCGHVIEPIPSKQWFIDVNEEFKFKQSKDHPLKGLKEGQKVTLKKLMQQVVTNGQIEIIPDRFNKTYFNWIDNLRDWCISRQIWYGHRIPVWYRKLKVESLKSKDDETEEIFVGVDAPTGEGWEQDKDTLDTWFSSGLWTFSTLGYPNLDASDLKNYHPTSVMETGYDIIFFWVARMILMTTYVLGEIPFEKVYLHGLVRDEKGRKMSKSLGNVIDPLDMISKYGADATRLSLLVGNTPGNDMKLSEEKIAGFRNFTNKLWNIARYILSQINNEQLTTNKIEPKTLADRWILARLNEVAKQVTENLEKLQFSLAGEQLRDFTWGEFADWYLEISKIENGKEAILKYVLESLLKLWHPFMPFVTEAIWGEMNGKENILMVEKWPEQLLGEVKVANGNKTNWQKIDTNAINDFHRIQNLILGIRSLRADYKIEPALVLSLELDTKNKEVINNCTLIERLARVSITSSKSDKKHYVLVRADSSLIARIDLFGVVDFAKEKERLKKEIQDLENYKNSLEKKLSNQEFVKNAPKAVVDKEKAKLAEVGEKINKFKAQLKFLP